MSSGECQRATIARALAVDPSIMICDEITSSLDVSVQAQIIDLLLTLKEKGYGSVTHSIYPKSSVFYTDSAVQKSYDIDQANAILDEAGYMDTNGDGFRKWMAEIFS